MSAGKTGESEKFHLTDPQQFAETKPNGAPSRRFVLTRR